MFGVRGLLVIGDGLGGGWRGDGVYHGIYIGGGGCITYSPVSPGGHLED